MNYYCCNSALIPNDEVSAKGSKGGMIVLDRTPSLVLQDLHQMMNFYRMTWQKSGNSR